MEVCSVRDDRISHFYRTGRGSAPQDPLNSAPLGGIHLQRKGTRFMKRTFTLTVALAFVLSLAAFAAEPQEPKTTEPASAAAKKTDAFKSEKEKDSYAIGMQIGGQLKMAKDNVDLKSLVQGLQDQFNGDKTLLTEEDAAKTAQEFVQKVQGKVKAEHEAKMKAEGEANQKAGKAFLDANKKKDGVKVTDSGLQYKVVKEGDGPKPGPDDRVKVNYKGTLIDGTVFDSTEKHGQPAVLALNRVIKGMSEALQMMKVGSKYEIYIPAELAYGPHGQPPMIGPNATLIFDVELLGIEKPQAAPAAPHPPMGVKPGQK